MKRCQDCKHSCNIESSMTAEECTERAASLGKMWDNIQAEIDKSRRGFWGWIPSHMIYHMDSERSMISR